ncbi:8897_t:CDS:2, partial [Cetraspora pellucida]
SSVSENYQFPEDYHSLFDDGNEEKLSELIDDNSLIEETSLLDFIPEVINLELETSLFDWKDIDNELLNEVAQLFTNMIAWSPKAAPEKLQDYFNNKCKDVVHGFENLHIYIQFIKLSMDQLKRFISEQELKMTTVFPLIHRMFSQNVIDDKWGEVQFLATNEALNESNNPFQRAKVGHKADMKGILMNTSCKLEALYGEVSGGLGPFGLSIASRKEKYLDKVKLSIMMRDSINKALKQWKHISDEDRKSLVVYGFTQD